MAELGPPGLPVLNLINERRLGKTAQYLSEVVEECRVEPG
jgi:hypothetical protein